MVRPLERLGLGAALGESGVRLTNSVPTRYAPDISGVCTTVLQIGGALGVAAFGSLYLGEAAGGGAGPARHAFAVTCIALAATALVAVFTARVSTRAGAASAAESTS
jgi:hypothetical protein